ncbi:hypothetical protein HMPREF1544_01158 [Mucor circinelloides 1006PhL]|uniref:Fork-head domain-containing protein n=1 Tax=Mucor circinelloides f. circinelloides (strain 1006PhL) TaxID=1220926 RepID=S2JQ42_MUCC1|nr:hypothetical protein HMPREF1544_01158 [Mucor circinelloides 1006PhL]
MSQQQQQDQQCYSSMDSSQNDGYSVMHSFPFINDGPKSSHRHSYTPSTSYQQQQQSLQKQPSQLPIDKPKLTKQVPPGVIHIKPTWKPVKLDEKPPFSYATIIAHAILSSENRKLTLSEIYQWISEQYPCYSMKDHRWQNSIRHNLSLQKAFVKLDRDANTPSGKGCFWTILPGYEQQFIDNLVKRGMGSAAGSPSNRKHANSLNSTSTSKQFRKFIDASVNKSNSPLFTIFRMNPTTTSTSETSGPSSKRKKTSHTKKMEVKQHEEPDLQYDSDCDSGVDLGCEPHSKKAQRPVSMYTQTTHKSAPLAPIPSFSLQTQQSYNSLLMENSMFIPDELFATQQPNVMMSTTSDDNVSYFDTISTPSSVIMDQHLFSQDPSLDNWPQSAQQTPMFDFQPQSQLLATQTAPYYDPSTASFASLSTDSNPNDYLLQKPHQSFQDYYLYNDFC